MSYPQRSEDVSHPVLSGITQKRLPLFEGGHYAAWNLSSAQAWERLDGEDAVQMRVWSAPGLEKPSFEDAMLSVGNVDACKPYRKGDWLGLSWTNHWVHLSIRIPEHYVRSGEPVVFEFDPSCEALIFTTDGKPIHAITGGPHSMKDGVPGSQEDRRIEHILPREAVEAGFYECIIEVSCNAMFGIGLNGFRHQRPDMNMRYQLKLADLVLQNSQGVELQVDFQMLQQVATAPLAEASPVSRKALTACNDIMNRFRRHHGDVQNDELKQTIAACRKIAASVFGDLSQDRLAKLCTHDPNAGGDAQIWGIGHCHIDTAWLWTYSVSQQKIARSWSTQVDLMRRFPNHQFAASSAQHYAWLEKFYPSLFLDVKEMVKQNRFHPVGGAWLEHDCILPSGESLCRQYLYGQAYFKRHFNITAQEAWLPDTFGYSSQLPQILRLAGIRYFFTQKLSWNNINVFPYSTFNWCGLDGSQVLAHMTPIDTYNAGCNYGELLKGVRMNRPGAEQCLLLFGNGDGGGGPTPHMLRKLERLSALCDTNRECPEVKIGKVQDFFDDVLQKSDNGSKLPTWSRQELYFELHRGTYTSQAGIKAGNRAMERGLRDLEYYATLASLVDVSYTYPKELLDDIWRDTLLGQFHDVIPGTSIRMAIDDQLQIYQHRKQDLADALQKAFETIQQTQSCAGFDPLRLSRMLVSQCDASGQRKLLVCDGSGLLYDGDAHKDNSASKGWSCQAPSASADGRSAVLESSQLRLEFREGRIASLYDKVLSRELILASSSTASGGLNIYEDFPLAYDAWDSEVYALDMGSEIIFDNIQVHEASNLVAAVQATAKFGDSVAKLTFAMDALVDLGNPDRRSPIRVDCEIDWHERHRFLKFVLPLDIHASNATYGTQFGLVERPTHRNTTLDQAKFEVCAHGFGDLSEPGYGVAIASDHKYGYSVQGNLMRFSMLRAATAPDPEQDQGVHHFSFAILPHANRLQESTVVTDALALNNSVHVLSARATLTNAEISSAQTSLPTIQIEGDQRGGLICETVKRGESDTIDGTRSVVIRLYESLGGRARGELVVGNLNVGHVDEVNILEEVTKSRLDMQTDGPQTRIPLDFRGFEIKTIRLVLR